MRGTQLLSRACDKQLVPNGILPSALERAGLWNGSGPGQLGWDLACGFGPKLCDVLGQK